MEVEITSKELIKPSSPTPPQLRIHKLSMFDQLVGTVHVPMVLYYHSKLPQNPNQKLQLLKQSLSQTLSRFYPLAGVIKDEFSIDCNDEGVSYVEARVQANLHEFLDIPDISLIHHLLPTHAVFEESSAGAKVALVQISVFDCGGISIGVYILHTVLDGLGMSIFLKDWGAEARGCCVGIVAPDFTTAPTLFPQMASFRDEANLMAMFVPFFRTGKCVTGRFVFDASALARLKVKSTNALTQNPTRVEVVTALIWKYVMAAINSNSGIPKPSLVSHTVNLRFRESPPLSEYLMGNLLGMTFAEADTDTDTELGDLVFKLRQAIAKLSGGFLKKLEGDQGGHNFCESTKEMGGIFSNSSNKGAEYIAFSSWCRFGFHEVDFGWGKPIWASHAGSRRGETSTFMNLVYLMDNEGGDAIEAWVILEEQDMAVLERDERFLEFASLNPSPLNVGHSAFHT